MYFKLMLSEEEYEELKDRAGKEGLDSTAYIRKCLQLDASEKNIFTVEYAVDLAKNKWPKGKAFTLYELYGDDWSKVQNGIAGVLGRNFYTYVTRRPDSGIAILGKKEVVIGKQKRMQNEYILKNAL